MLEVRASAKLRFHLLGEAVLNSDSGIVRISSQKGFALLAYLAMNRGRVLNRTVVADLLWGDRGEASARQNLRQAIHTLRRDLGPLHSAALQANDQSISLVAESTEVDALQFAAWAQDSDPAIRFRCLDLPWGPFLHGFCVSSEPFNEWLLAERHRLDAIATRAFSDLAKQCDDAEDGPRAIFALERLIAIDPGEEDRHRRLLLLEARYRGPDAALARAKALAAMLKSELDAEPEAATQALVDEIRERSAVRNVYPGLDRAASTDPRPEISQAGGNPATKVDAPPPARHPYWRYAATAIGMVLVSVAIAMLVRSDVARTVRAPTQAEDHATAVEPSWQSPRSPSEMASDSIARQRGLVAMAVLPMRTYDGAGADLLAEILTEDLTHLLSRVPSFRIISRQTAMSYRGQSIDAAKVGSELGVKYLVEGSVSLAGQVLQVNVALIDTKTRLQVWSGRFERVGGDRSKIQSEILKGIARELNVSVHAVEIAQSSKDPDVHALIFQGYAAIQASRQLGVEGLRPAEGLFTQALKRDPDAVRAKIGLGLFHAHMAVQMFAPDPAPHLAQAEGILHDIAATHPNLSEPQGGLGLVHIARGEHNKALAAFARAIELNPSDAPSYAQLGRTLVRLGRENEGLEHILYAMRLSPRDPVIGYWMAFAGYAELELGNYENAIAHLSRAHALNPTQPRTLLSLISANMWAGHVQVARQQLGQLQKDHPHLTHARLREMYERTKSKKNSAGVLQAVESNGAPAAELDTWTSPPLPSGRTPNGTEARQGVIPIIVVPFRTYDDAPSVRLLADMVSDDVTNTLSRVRFFRVISRQTARTLQTQSADIVAKAKEIGVRYVVDGGIRMNGDKLRIAVELTDVDTRAVSWSTRFEREHADRQGVLDEIVQRLVRELQVGSFPIERARLSDNADADALSYRGMAALHEAFSNISLQAYQKAEVLFLQSLERDPTNLMARLGLASYHANVGVQRLVPDSGSHIKKAQDIVAAVIREKPTISGAHHTLGIILQGSGRIKEAISAFERAIEINPSSAGSYAHIGFALARLGRAKEGIEHIRYAMRLSPRDPSLAIWTEFAGATELELGQFAEAMDKFRQAIEMTPAYPRPWAGLIAAQALAGRLDEARASAEKLKVLLQNPSEENLYRRFGRHGSQSVRLREGLRIALSLTDDK